MIPSFRNYLAVKLIIYLALIQIVVVVSGMAGWMMFSSAVTWDDVASEGAADAVASAVIRVADDRFVIERTAELSDYIRRRPTLRFALVKDNQIVDGSSADLSDILRTFGALLPREGRLALPLSNGDIAAFKPVQNDFGDFIAVTSGNAFLFPDDLATFVRTYLVVLIPLFGPALIAALISIPIIVFYAFQPIRGAVRLAESMNVESLTERFETKQIPRELAPFFSAINRLVDRLQKGIEQQSLFTANAAHELRTPVAILQARIMNLPSRFEERNVLEENVKRVTNVLDQLLSIARLRAIRSEAKLPTPLSELARTVISDVAPLFARSRKNLELRVIQDHIVSVEAGAIQSSIQNILDNALRAIDEHETVSVVVGPEKAISIIDRGMGVRDENKPHIFEAFWRGDSLTRGSGLGLSIVAETMRLHDGSVSIEDTEGGGSTFILHFV